MAHTDKTDPYHVKGAWEARARHNHAGRECDLPPIRKHVAPRDQNWQGCHWDWNWYAGYMKCPCAMCHGGYGYAMTEHHKQRASAKQQIREQLEDLEPEICGCPCHFEDDHCAICTNDYANLCED